MLHQLQELLNKILRLWQKWILSGRNYGFQWFAQQYQMSTQTQTVGIAEMNSDHGGISIYPNPTSQDAVLILPGQAYIQVDLMSAEGKLLTQCTIVSQPKSNKWFLSDLQIWQVAFIFLKLYVIIVSIIERSYWTILSICINSDGSFYCLPQLLSGPVPKQKISRQ